MELFPYWSGGYRHPLGSSWTLWYLDNNKTKVWEECLTQVGTFSSIEDFWTLFNRIKPVSALKSGCDYSLFKTGIRPMWEDASNREGGRWLIHLDKNLANHKLNQFWMEVAMCMIGECFGEYNNLICGATMSIRNKGNKIGLWVSNSCNDRGEIIHIGLKLRELLGFNQSQVIFYQKHKDSLEKNGGKTKYTYYV